MTLRIVRSLSPFGRGVLVAFVFMGMFALGALAQEARAKKKTVQHKCFRTSARADDITEELNDLAKKGWRLRTTSILSTGMNYKTLVCVTR